MTTNDSKEVLYINDVQGTISSVYFCSNTLNHILFLYGDHIMTRLVTCNRIDLAFNGGRGLGTVFFILLMYIL